MEVLCDKKLYDADDGEFVGRCILKLGHKYEHEARMLQVSVDYQLNDESPETAHGTVAPIPTNKSVQPATEGR